MFLSSTLLEDITTRISPLIDDTGVTGTFLERNTPHFTNIKKADPGIDVLCPNTQFLTSTHTSDITYDYLLHKCKSTHPFRKLVLESLLCIDQLRDSGYEVF